MNDFHTQELTKRYYSIGEVAEMFDVSKSLIRYWEQEFDVFKPHKTRSGERKFTPENITQFLQIYQLVKERGFTLNGAKIEIQRLKSTEKRHKEILKSLKQTRHSSSS
jgi:DNA-binding transcriptional MerR regulator